jgi:multiple antibiotic resistance protein
MLFFSITFSLFLLMDSIGNIPLYIILLHGMEEKKQLRIILREMIIALITIILFYFLGEALLSFLHIRLEAIKISGAIILFLISLKMVFPSKEGDVQEFRQIADPFIVPLAIPLVAGPAVLASVMLLSKQGLSPLLMMGAIFLSWSASLLVLISAPFLRKKLGTQGIFATQKLMGLILILLSVEMFLDGLASFLHIHPS